jgi:hypothetical protein
MFKSLHLNAWNGDFIRSLFHWNFNWIITLNSELGTKWWSYLNRITEGIQWFLIRLLINFLFNFLMIDFDTFSFNVYQLQLLLDTLLWSSCCFCSIFIFVVVSADFANNVWYSVLLVLIKSLLSKLNICSYLSIICCDLLESYRTFYG